MTCKLSIEQQNLVVSHLFLAHKFACSVKKKAFFLNYDELKSAAYLGLSEAALKYDCSLCDSFEAYASYRISGAIKDYMRELSWGSRDNPLKMESFEFQKEPIYNDVIGEDFNVFEKITKPLSSIKKKVLLRYYVEGTKIKDIADDMGVHESRISQILSSSRNELSQYWKEVKSDLLAEVA
jgi:RNA polymerase sigma factor (sigma-70 family)